MPRLEYFLVAESISLDRESDSVSIFHVLNDVPVRSLPTRLPQLATVSAWISSDDEIREQAESQIRLEFTVPGIEEPVAFRGNLTSQTRYQNYNFTFVDVPVPEAGEMIVAIFLNDERKASHTITIRKVDPGELES